MPDVLPPDDAERGRAKKKALPAWATNPVLLSAVAGVLLLLLSVAAYQSEVGGAWSGRKPFVPHEDQQLDAPAPKSLVRTLVSRLPFFGGSADPAGSSSAREVRADPSKGEYAGGAKVKGEGPTREADELADLEEETEEAQKAVKEAADQVANGGPAAGVQGAKFGGLSGSAPSGGTGSGAGSPSSTSGSAPMATASSAGGASTPRQDAERRFTQANVRSGADSRSGPASQAQSLMAKNKGGSGKAPTASGAATHATGAAAGSGQAGGAGGSSIGGAGGMIGAGASGAVQGSQNGDGGVGGGGDGGGGGGASKIQGFASAVSEFESQTALADGRNYIDCLIRAFKVRYTKTRDKIETLKNDVNRDVAYFTKDYPSAAVEKTLTELKNNLEDQDGLLKMLQKQIDGLAEGEKCYPANLEADQMIKCYERWQGPIVGMELTIQQIDGFYTLVNTEGQAAIQYLVKSKPPKDKHLTDKLEAIKILSDGVKNYQGKLGLAKDDLSGVTHTQVKLGFFKKDIAGQMSWGHEDEAIELAEKYVVPYTTSRLRLNDIQSSELPRKKQPIWEEAQRSANLSLEMAHTAWNEIEKQPSAVKKIMTFLEAHRATQYAANELVLGAVALGIRAAPPDGKTPSSQFLAVQKIDVGKCDVPPPPPNLGK